MNSQERLFSTSRDTLGVEGGYFVGAENDRMSKPVAEFGEGGMILALR